jgi:hypothetical protein
MKTINLNGNKKTKLSLDRVEVLLLLIAFGAFALLIHIALQLELPAPAAPAAIVDWGKPCPSITPATLFNEWENLMGKYPVTKSNEFGMGEDIMIESRLRHPDHIVCGSKSFAVVKNDPAFGPLIVSENQPGQLVVMFNQKQLLKVMK